MSRRKRKSGIWHHRVPDFKLVIADQKKAFLRKKRNLPLEKKSLKQKISTIQLQVDYYKNKKLIDPL